MATEDAVGCETSDRAPAGLRRSAQRRRQPVSRARPAAATRSGISRSSHASSRSRRRARYNVGVALEASGRAADAAPQYEAALQARPGVLAGAQQSRQPAPRRRARRRGAPRVRTRGGIGTDATPRRTTTSARCCSHPNDAAGAIPHLRQAIELRPIYPEAHFNLARAYASTRQFEAAIRAATVARDAGRGGGQDRPARPHSRTAADLSRRDQTMTRSANLLLLT